MTKDPSPTVNDNDCAEPVSITLPTDADPRAVFKIVDDALAAPVTDHYFYSKTNAAFGGEGNCVRLGAVTYAGGSRRRRDIAGFFEKMSPTCIGEFVDAARPLTIPQTVWSAFTRDLDSKVSTARSAHDDRAIDALLGNAAEDLMDCAPIAAAMLVIARVQNRCSLELATGGHHPLSPAKGDRAASARAENFIYEALTTVEWRA